MRKRVVGGVILSALALGGLSGCQAVAPGGFTRATAQADVAGWTHDAQKALGSPAASIRANDFETCRTDHSYFSTSFEWRTITNLSVPAARQAAAIRTLASAFVASGWVRSNPDGLVTLTGPTDARRRGLIRVEYGGASTLVLSVLSPCYP